jgi:hypothetical protein
MGGKCRNCTTSRIPFLCNVFCLRRCEFSQMGRFLGAVDCSEVGLRLGLPLGLSWA